MPKDPENMFFGSLLFGWQLIGRLLKLFDRV
jgi:hypothetical protein